MCKTNASHTSKTEMQAAEEKEFRLVLSEFTKKLAAGFIRATGSIFFLSFSSAQSENRPFITMTCRFSICFRWNRTIVSAAECGAPHRRDRVFIVAYPVCIGRVERKRLEEKIQPSQFARLQREESQQPIVSKSIHSGNEATTNTNKNR